MSTTTAACRVLSSQKAMLVTATTRSSSGTRVGTATRCLSSITVPAVEPQIHRQLEQHEGHRFLSSLKQNKGEVARKQHSSSSQDVGRPRIKNSRNNKSFSVMEVMVPVLDLPQSRLKSMTNKIDDILEHKNEDLIAMETIITQDPLVKQLAFKLQKVSNLQRQEQHR